MKKIYVLMPYVVAITLALSCGTKNNKAQTNSDAAKAQSTAALPDTHNARNSLDYEGRYHGALPTASGEGMDVCITLQDSTYAKEVVYIGKSENPIVSTGVYTWNDAGNTITLIGEDKPNQYFVGENTLIHLDIDGNKIEGELADKYILRKE